MLFRMPAKQNPHIHGRWVNPKPKPNRTEPNWAELNFSITKQASSHPLSSIPSSHAYPYLAERSSVCLYLMFYVCMLIPSPASSISHYNSPAAPRRQQSVARHPRFRNPNPIYGAHLHLHAQLHSHIHTHCHPSIGRPLLRCLFPLLWLLSSLLPALAVTGCWPKRNRCSARNYSVYIMIIMPYIVQSVVC